MRWSWCLVAAVVLAGCSAQTGTKADLAGAAPPQPADQAVPAAPATIDHGPLEAFAWKPGLTWTYELDQTLASRFRYDGESESERLDFQGPATFTLVQAGVPSTLGPVAILRLEREVNGTPVVEPAAWSHGLDALAFEWALADEGCGAADVCAKPLQGEHLEDSSEPLGLPFPVAPGASWDPGLPFPFQGEATAVAWELADVGGLQVAALHVRIAFLLHPDAEDELPPGWTATVRGARDLWVAPDVQGIVRATSDVEFTMKGKGFDGSQAEIRVEATANDRLTSFATGPAPSLEELAVEAGLKPASPAPGRHDLTILPHPSRLNATQEWAFAAATEAAGEVSWNVVRVADGETVAAGAGDTFLWVAEAGSYQVVAEVVDASGGVLASDASAVLVDLRLAVTASCATTVSLPLEPSPEACGDANATLPPGHFAVDASVMAPAAGGAVPCPYLALAVDGTETHRQYAAAGLGEASLATAVSLEVPSLVSVLWVPSVGVAGDAEYTVTFTAVDEPAETGESNEC